MEINHPAILYIIDKTCEKHGCKLFFNYDDGDYLIERKDGTTKKMSTEKINMLFEQDDYISIYGYLDALSGVNDECINSL